MGWFWSKVHACWFLYSPLSFSKGVGHPQGYLFFFRVDTEIGPVVCGGRGECGYRGSEVLNRRRLEAIAPCATPKAAAFPPKNYPALAITTRSRPTARPSGRGTCQRRSLLPSTEKTIVASPGG